MAAGPAGPPGAGSRRRGRACPTAMTSRAMTTATTRWRPVLERGRRGPGGRSGPAGTPAQVVELVEVGVLAEGRPDAAGEDRHLGAARRAARGRSREAATALAAASPWWVRRLRYCDSRALPRTCSRRTSASGNRRCWAELAPQQARARSRLLGVPRQAPTTARTRSPSRANTATTPLRGPAAPACGNTRKRWNRV